MNLINNIGIRDEKNKVSDIFLAFSLVLFGLILIKSVINKL
jgi:hypothetical protein